MSKLRRNFTIDDVAASLIDDMPNGEKSKFVTEAIKEKAAREAQLEENQKIMAFINTITPVDTGDGKTSMQALEDARNARIEQRDGQ